MGSHLSGKVLFYFVATALGISIHAFLKGENYNIKQTPLVLVLMSRRKSKDYVTILKAVIQLFGSNTSIEQAVLDFETAAWKGCRKVITSNIQGCSFHLTQAIWRKVQNIGLATSYRNDPAVHSFIWSMLPLPSFLPSTLHYAISCFGSICRTNMDPRQYLVARHLVCL